MDNQFKLTVFVEGLAEQIFVRQLLHAWFGYDENQVGFECLTLHRGQYGNVPYDIGSLKVSQCFYQIINTGNDNKVVQQVADHSVSLSSKGFGIIGLRDMYSQAYLEHAKKRKCLAVHTDINERFVASVNAHLDETLPHDVRANAHICFAIMEVEAWILAMKGYGENNVEEIFHPAERLKNEIPGYDKHGKQIESLVSTWQKEDFMKLYSSGQCPSFNQFLQLLIPLQFLPNCLTSTEDR